MLLKAAMALGHARGSKLRISLRMAGLRCCGGTDHDLADAVLYPDGLASQEARDLMVRTGQENKLLSKLRSAVPPSPLHTPPAPHPVMLFTADP
jgi:hypothetical protein